MEAAFNSDLLTLVEELDYCVITAVIDKREHLDRYQQWVYDPYHYCLMVILERYVLELHGRGQRGDVMAESRGGSEESSLGFTRRAPLLAITVSPSGSRASS